MKIFDLIKIAAKELRGFRTVLMAFIMAAAAFCLCFAGAILISISQEEWMPYEISVSYNKVLKDADITILSAVSDVEESTLVLQVPVTIKTGEYSAELTLTGIASSYIDKKFTQGGVFPDSSVMPYIILNNAACKEFEKPGSIPQADSTGNEIKEIPDINWLSTGFTIQSGGEKSGSIVANVCGILKSEDEDQQDQQPQGYISIAAAKELLGGEADVYTANVRIKNIGCAPTVSQSLEKLGYEVSNPNEDLQKKWDGEYGEMAYLIVIGASLLLCSSVISVMRRKLSVLQQKDAYVMLCWMGMKEKDIGNIFVFQSVVLSLIGITIGTIIALGLPSFLSQDLIGLSVYMLPIPFEASSLSVIVCIIAGVFPPIFTGDKLLTDLW